MLPCGVHLVRTLFQIGSPLLLLLLLLQLAMVYMLFVLLLKTTLTVGTSTRGKPTMIPYSNTTSVILVLGVIVGCPSLRLF